jgi:cell division transport system permease protein
MTTYMTRAMKDMVENGYLNAVAVVIITLSVLIVNTFGLFVLNAGDLISSWKKGIRIMAYLKPGISSEKLLEVEVKIRGLKGVQGIDFISKESAFTFLKDKMKGQSSLLENLEENPLPDSFEISLVPELRDIREIEALAAQIDSDPYVVDVEYGQAWLKQFAYVFELFRLAAFGIGGLFFMAAVFIIGNTIRLVLYSRREEIEIMRFIGASDGFIKMPFYLEGSILGGLGGVIGLAGSYMGYLTLSSNMAQGFSSAFFHIRFFPFNISMGILACSVLVGWLGCFLSLKQFLRQY